MSEHRDKDATKKFFKKALKAIHNQQPRVITTDRYAATEIAIHEMIYSGIISVKTTIRQVKYLNNIIEVMHMIRKGQVEEIQSALSEVKFINKIMGIQLNTEVNLGFF